MSKNFDLLLKNATVVTHKAIGEADIGVINGRIAEVGDLSQAAGDKEMDVRGLHLLPGVIDTQVHFREPGNDEKEDLESGSRAAVMGGVTAVFEMPNTDPPTTTQDAIEDKLKRARGRMWCDHAFYVGASSENADQLAELERLPGTAGVKIFMGSSTGSLLVPDDDTLRRVLKSGKRRVAVHAEDEERLEERKGERKEGEPASHAEWRDEDTALLATRRITALAEETGRPVHVLHVTSRAEMKFLREKKDVVSVETTPQHLTLAAPDCYKRLGTYAQMNPPIRSEEHRDAIWRAVDNGTVDLIGSDHAPHTKEDKDKPYPGSPSGMPGVQTLLPLLLDHLNDGRLTLERLVELTSGAAIRLFGIRGKGRIQKGADADFTLVDLKRDFTVSPDWLQSKCGWSPFEGETLRGYPIGTIVRGRIAMWDGELQGEPTGEPLNFDFDN